LIATPLMVSTLPVISSSPTSTFHIRPPAAKSPPRAPPLFPAGTSSSYSESPRRTSSFESGADNDKQVDVKCLPVSRKFLADRLAVSQPCDYGIQMRSSISPLPT
jgi:hypothetical protein